jgi:hypothetical protein
MSRSATGSTRWPTCGSTPRPIAGPSTCSPRNSPGWNRSRLCPTTAASTATSKPTANAGSTCEAAATQAAGTGLPQELRKFTTPALLAIDELGFLPLDKTAADLFFQVVSERYERGAIVLTTNRAYKQWVITFNNDSVFTAALLDRLLHHSHTVIIDGPSYRGNKAQQQP